HAALSEDALHVIAATDDLTDEAGLLGFSDGHRGPAARAEPRALDVVVSTRIALHGTSGRREPFLPWTCEPHQGLSMNGPAILRGYRFSALRLRKSSFPAGVRCGRGPPSRATYSGARSGRACRPRR